MTKDFLFYTWNYRKNKRHYITDELEKVDPKKVLVFKNRKMVNKWLETVEKKGEIDAI